MHEMRRLITLLEAPQALTLTSGEIYDYVRKLHSRPEDFHEGDISDRIFRFTKYVLMDVPLNKVRLTAYDVSPEQVATYVERLRVQPDYPPIVFDGVGNDIIDGIHRANAVAQTGATSVRAYVGLPENLDPKWEATKDE